MQPRQNLWKSIRAISFLSNWISILPSSFGRNTSSSHWKFDNFGPLTLFSSRYLNGHPLWAVRASDYGLSVPNLFAAVVLGSHSFQIQKHFCVSKSFIFDIFFKKKKKMGLCHLYFSNVSQKKRRHGAVCFGCNLWEYFATSDEMGSKVFFAKPLVYFLIFWCTATGKSHSKTIRLLSLELRNSHFVSSEPICCLLHRHPLSKFKSELVGMIETRPFLHKSCSVSQVRFFILFCCDERSS